MNNSKRKPKVGIVLGDPAGIGPEITLKLLRRPYTYEVCRPVLIGNYELLSRVADKIVPDLFLSRYTMDEMPEDIEQIFASGIPVIHIEGNILKVETGKVGAESGLIAYRSICTGYELIEKNLIEGLIMAPINKEALAKSGCGYTSEYELFADLAGVKEVRTVVKGGNVFRSTVIGHMPFRDIMKHLTTNRIVQTGIGLNRVFRLVVNNPVRIAIAALNPHAGEGGSMDLEETEIILPAIEKLRNMGIDVVGPYPADTIFIRAMKSEFNGIIYLYHDQGNIAMKTKMFESTAIIYTNVPYPIFSTGHGSAMDIAKLGIANSTNLSYVIKTLSETLKLQYTYEKDAIDAKRGTLLT